MASMWRALPAILLGAVTAAPPAAGAIVISEVYFDPPGPDDGSEWVELHNSGIAAVTLEGLALESGNGSGPGQWRRFWLGGAGEWIEPGGYYVVGGAYRGRAPDAPATCDLQNGPDGVRLRRESWELDRVGWGDLLWPEYFEGVPATVPRSGRSLGRAHEDADSDDNARDFAALDPSPGRRNLSRVDLALRARPAGRPFPVPAGAAGVPVRAWVRNRGSTAVPVDSVRLLVDGRACEAARAPSSRSISAGDSALWDLRLEPGGVGPVHLWVVHVRHPGDEGPENDGDTLRLRAWPPPLRLSEVSPRPKEGETEWIELSVTGSEAVPLAGWRVEDAGGTALRLTEARAGAPGEHLLLLRDSAAPVGFPPSARVPSWTGSWPPLNDAAGEDGAADTLWLRDPDGLAADWAVWGRTERGQTWIRSTDSGEAQGLDAWIAVNADRSSPGAPNPPVHALPAPPATGLAPAGVSFSRHPDGMWMQLPDDVASGAWCLRLFDLEGRELWRREGRENAGGSRWIRWDGRDRAGTIRPGFVLVELLRQDGGDAPRTSLQSLWVGR